MACRYGEEIRRSNTVRSLVSLFETGNGLAGNGLIDTPRRKISKDKSWNSRYESNKNYWLCLEKIAVKSTSVGSQTSRPSGSGDGPGRALYNSRGCQTARYDEAAIKMFPYAQGAFGGGETRAKVEVEVKEGGNEDKNIDVPCVGRNPSDVMACDSYKWRRHSSPECLNWDRSPVSTLMTEGYFHGQIYGGASISFESSEDMLEEWINETVPCESISEERTEVGECVTALCKNNVANGGIHMQLCGLDVDGGQIGVIAYAKASLSVENNAIVVSSTSQFGQKSSWSFKKSQMHDYESDKDIIKSYLGNMKIAARVKDNINNGLALFLTVENIQNKRGKRYEFLCLFYNTRDKVMFAQSLDSDF